MTGLSIPPGIPPRSAAMPQARDYARVVRAMDYMLAHWRTQPGLAEIAAHVAMSPGRLQRLFSRWAGLSPKAFVQALTLEHARRLLENATPVEAAAWDVGLSGSARLHDLFVTWEAMTPGAFRARGRGLVMRWGVHDSPFGACLLMATERGLAGLAFADDAASARRCVLADMSARWPAAHVSEDAAATAPYAARIFAPAPAGPPLHLIFVGTGFQVRVWRALLAVPRGAAVSYGELARGLGAPGAARAVGSAVGCNPISYVVPCHRVLRHGGALGGYRWGLARKRALIAFETAGPLKPRGHREAPAFSSSPARLRR